MSQFATGWIPSGDHSGYTLPQAFSDDAKTRLITSLFDLLQRTQQINSQNEIIKSLLPTAIDAIIAETKDVPPAVKTALAEIVSEVIKSAGFVAPAGEKSLLQPLKANPLSVLTKRDFSDFISTIIYIVITGDVEDSSSTVQNSLIKVASTTIDALSSLGHIRAEEKTELIDKLPTLLASGILSEERISELIDTTRRAVQEAIENQVTLVKFDWAVDHEAFFEYIETPIPEKVLTATRAKLFPYLSIDTIQQRFNEAAEASTVTAKIQDATAPIADAAREAAREFSQSRVMQGIKENPIIQGVSESMDRVSDRINQRANLVSESFESMLFPIARYVIRENTPLGVVDDDASDQRLSDALDKFFDFFDNYSDRIRDVLRDRNGRTGRTEKMAQDWSLVSAIHEAAELGLQAIENLQKDSSLKVISEHFSPLNRLKERLRSYDARQQRFEGYFREIYSENFLRMDPSPPKLALESLREQQNTETIWVPMTYASEKALSAKTSSGIRLPNFVDLSDWLPPIVDDNNQGGQGKLNDCTAHAAKTIVEFLHSQNDDADTPEPFKASALFLYRAALDFRETHEPSDTPAGQTMAAQTADAQTMDKGVSIGNIMSALIRLGVPAEQAWPYPPHTQDETAHREQLARDPHPSCYLSAREFQISKYFRLDQDPTRDRHLLLAQIKAVLASGLPCMFGFGAVQALEQTLADGNIPYLTPQAGEAKGINTPVAVMGHALVAMGYDDAKVIGDRSGALLVRNSWVSNDGGTRQPWGDGGYGWLPYEYVLEPEPASRVADCWTLVDWKSVQRKAIAGKFGIRLGDQTPRPGRP